MAIDQTPGSDGYRPMFDAKKFDDHPVVPTYIEDIKLRVSVAKIDGDLFAFDDLCTHEHCPLSAGLMEGTTISCQCHGSKFDVTTGKVLQGPAISALRTYPVRETDGTIEAKV